MSGLEEQVIVSCEHASNRLLPGLSLDPDLLSLHIAYDPGAAPVARHLARRFHAPLFTGEVSRLVVDLNRTVGNRMLIRRASDGHRIPFNYGLDPAERRRRIERYYEPYRSAVLAAARERVERAGRCVHLCVHTFTPTLAGKTRGNDIGLLHDPSWGRERQICRRMRAWLASRTDYVVWFNRPYSGTADGILPAMRRQFAPASFVGLEIEVNQRFAGEPTALREIARCLAAALVAAEEGGREDLPARS